MCLPLTLCQSSSSQRTGEIHTGHRQAGCSFGKQFSSLKKTKTRKGQKKKIYISISRYWSLWINCLMDKPLPRLLFLYRPVQLPQPPALFSLQVHTENHTSDNKVENNWLWDQSVFLQPLVTWQHNWRWDLTLVPDGVLRGVDLRPRPLLDPGQSCSSGPLGSFTGSIPKVLCSRAALHLIGLGAAVSQVHKEKVSFISF